MPDGKRDITHFTRYFSIEVPRSQYLALFLLFIGAAAGIIAELLIRFMGYNLSSTVVYGIGAGVAMVALPAMLTAMLIKAMNRKLRMRHAFVAVIAITLAYAFFLILDAAVFRITQSYVLVYIIFLLANGFIYGYWFMISRVVFNRRRSPIITAALQPLLNILLYLPVSAYLLSFQLPLNVLLIKLSAAMAVFLVCAYAILYLMDRPSKRALNFSGVELMGAMINQWLYDVSHDSDVLKDSGVPRDVPVDVLALRSSNGARAAFVKPEIHYGPIAGVGGAGTTEHLAKRLESVGSTPFVMHGAVNLEDNPISTNQVYELSDKVADALPRSGFSPARGGIAIGTSGPCKAIAIRINDLCLVLLTKAPKVTEDLDREVGRYLASVARHYVKNVILLDAHNTRFESASDDELRGVYTDSKYVKMYERAIRSAMSKLPKGGTPLSFGCASSVVPENIRKKDMGKGHISAAIFQFGKSRFCMVYFDSNNMLPGFRSAVLAHIRKKYGLEAELCTTDTHAVNSLSLSAANALGRETQAAEILPTLDIILDKALSSTGSAKSAYKGLILENFKVWGHGSEDVITKVSRDIIKLGKKRMPILIAAFCIIAVWVIYLA